MSRPVVRGIVSGGQTGVDRAALDVALELGIACGGWCPAGRRAEDGRIPPGYPVVETYSSDAAQRTTWNVFDSDATLLLHSGAASGGTTLARALAERFGRPHRTADPADPGELPALRRWLAGLPEPALLNVAGPRESEEPGVNESAHSFLRALLHDPAAAAAPPQPAPRVLITGGAGMLGARLARLAPPGREIHVTVRHARAPFAGPTHPVELSDPGGVRALLADVRPQLVIHTAYSLAAMERDVGEATRVVAQETARAGVDLIHVSTDMVLSGENGPFDEEAESAPLHAYGRWKALAEQYVRERHSRAAIVRTSLITSFDPPDPRTEWVVAGLRGEAEVTLFVDELRTPILVDDLARQIWEIARLSPPRRAGVWNLAGPESLSRFALGLLIAAAEGRTPAVLRAARSVDAQAARPRDLRLTTRRADRDLPTRARSLSEAAAARAAARSKSGRGVDPTR